MGIYRVSFMTSLVVECDSEMGAIRIGHRYLDEEVKNGTSQFYNVEELKKVDELRREERGSLPWRSSDRRGEPQLVVEDLLR